VGGREVCEGLRFITFMNGSPRLVDARGGEKSSMDDVALAVGWKQTTALSFSALANLR